MPLPSQLVYNDLNGEEICHILEERFHQLLQQVPYLQRHITLPRLRMTLQVHLDCYSDQPTPQRQTITDAVEIRGDGRASMNDFKPVFADTHPLGLPEGIDLEDSISAAPGRGGKTPDQLRDEHGLNIPSPERAPIGLQDSVGETVEGRRIRGASGLVFDRTGEAPERAGSTVVVQDFGRAGLATGDFKRNQLDFGNKNQRDGQPVAPPKIPR